MTQSPTRRIRSTVGMLGLVALAYAPLACSGDDDDVAAATSPATVAPTTAAATTVPVTDPVVTAATSATSATPADEVADVEPMLTPVVGSVLHAPVPVTGSDGNDHLVYELLITNYTPSALSISALDVLDAATGDSVTSYGTEELATRLRPMGTDIFGTDLASGQSGAVFIHVVAGPDDAVPDELVHQFTLTMASMPPDADPIVERIAPTSVDRRTLPVLGPPLIGDGYLAGDGCCDATRHTRSILPIDGAPYLSQRYAIDWEQINEEGRIYVGEQSDPESYFIYGDEALAVADGTVVMALDGLEEQVPGAYPEGISLIEADGNSVVLDIGDGFFVNYAHFQPGSVRVKVGDVVERGDVLGLVGNSGRSIAPHLHLHVMDTASPLLAEGLPYVIDAFTITARTASTADFDVAERDGTPLVTLPGMAPSDHEEQLPLDQSVVNFGVD